MDKLYDHSSGEKTARELWAQHKIYEYKKDSERQVYSIDTPPPTVSGTLHIGHIFSYTHTDIIARYKRMQGFNVFYPMGFDDNGLPTERYVEKQNKTKAHLMKRSEFIALCLKESAVIEKTFEDLWQKMGLSVDWTKIYSTISDRSRKISQYSFIDLYKKNLTYRKKEASLYCTTCRTSVAQAELDSNEVKTTFNDIQFTTESGEALTIATTRPELLPACVAVFFHPDDERYKHLEGLFALSPIFNKRVPLLADDLVEKDKGTGLVMCCTFGDQTDILWQKKHDLPFVQIIGLDGTWMPEAGVLEGLRVHEARKKILELLDESGFLLNQKSISHNVSVHERCKQEIEYQILSQWFVKILDHKQTFLDLADQINWKPAFMKARYKDWVSNLNWDWCISRQRFFGIPFPVWHCLDCSHVIVAELKDLPIDPQEQAYPGKTCPSCSSDNLTPDTDVMDTWNTSSLTPQINARWPEGASPFPLPMSMRPQAHDIIRTWAFYTIIKAYYHHQQIPWNDIVISGHVLAGKEKISKSKGGAKLTPEALLATYPADVIRFWSASGKLGTDTAFSDNQLRIGQKLVTKLWNAFRFCKEYIADFDPNSTTSQPTDDLNRWLLHNFSQTVNSYVKHFDNYEYSHALDTVERFFWHCFCDNYLELVKDQLFNPDEYGADVVAGTKQTLYTISLGILKLYAPFLPHITENLYQLMFKDRCDELSLHSMQLEQTAYVFSYEESVTFVTTLLDVVAQVRKLKSEHKVSLKTPLTKLTICSVDSSISAALQANKRLVIGITKANEIVISDGVAEKNVLTIDGDDVVAKISL